MGKGRGQWHKDEFNRNHQKMKAILIAAREGISKKSLVKKCGLTHPTVDKHVRLFGNNIVKENRLLFWTTNYHNIWRAKAKAIEDVFNIAWNLLLEHKIGLLPSDKVVTWEDLNRLVYEDIKRKEREPTIKIDDLYDAKKVKAEAVRLRAQAESMQK